MSVSPRLFAGRLPHLAITVFSSSTTESGVYGGIDCE